MNHLLFSSALSTNLQWMASAVVGLAVTWFAWWLFRVLQTEDMEQGAEWRYDVTRINELRRIDLIYRVFQPVIQILSRFNRTVFREGLPRLQQEIQAAGLPRYWMAEEYLARIELVTLFLIPLLVYCFFDLFGGVGLLLALLGWAVYLANAATFIVPVAYVPLMNRLQIIPEERALAALFGPGFADYQSKVRRWL